MPIENDNEIGEKGIAFEETKALPLSNSGLHHADWVVQGEDCDKL